jgi:hypothetical protein
MPASKAPTLVSQVNDDESLPSSFEQLELLTTDPVYWNSVRPDEVIWQFPFINSGAVLAAAAGPAPCHGRQQLACWLRQQQAAGWPAEASQAGFQSLSRRAAAAAGPAAAGTRTLRGGPARTEHRTRRTSPSTPADSHPCESGGVQQRRTAVVAARVGPATRAVAAESRWDPRVTCCRALSWEAG